MSSELTPVQRGWIKKAKQVLFNNEGEPDLDRIVFIDGDILVRTNFSASDMNKVVYVDMGTGDVVDLPRDYQGKHVTDIVAEKSSGVVMFRCGGVITSMKIRDRVFIDVVMRRVIRDMVMS